MAPNSGSSKATSGASKKNLKKTSSSSSTSRVSKSKSKNAVKRPPPKEVKAKPRTAPALQKKKQKRDYTEEELDLPTLNAITPVGVQKPKGKKKGKVFVDDKESMMTILAMVNAEKEGQIESKMMKARQMEEIREAKRKEAEARQQEKQSKLEETKEALRRQRKGKNKKGDEDTTEALSEVPAKSEKKKSKSVSFA